MGHGGRREGAGRKAIADETFIARPKLPLEWKVEMGDNISAFIRAAVKEKIERNRYEKNKNTVPRD